MIRRTFIKLAVALFGLRMTPATYREPRRITLERRTQERPKAAFLECPMTVNKSPVLGFASQSMLFASYSIEIDRGMAIERVTLCPFVAPGVVYVMGEPVTVRWFHTSIEWPSLDGFVEV